MIPYNIKRSRRKTMAIYILPDGQVEMRAPLKTPKYILDRFVMQKAQWIENTSAAAKKRYEKQQKFTLSDGCLLRYKGQRLPLVCCDLKKPLFDGECFYIPEGLSEEKTKEAVVKLYRLEAKKLLNEKVHYFALHMQASPTGVKINGARTRWGSCSGKNSLNFSWKLIMAPERAIDYVVIHELAHTFEHNHSAAFWKIVAAFMPDYKTQQLILKDLGASLSMENWDMVPDQGRKEQ